MKINWSDSDSLTTRNQLIHELYVFPSWKVPCSRKAPPCHDDHEQEDACVDAYMQKTGTFQE